MKINETTFARVVSNTTIPIKNLQACICIDTSSSTANFFTTKLKYLDVEKNFALSLKSFFTKEPYIVTWNHKSSSVADINLITSDGMTEPSCIIENKDTCELVKKSDILIILTDGEIDSQQVTIFGKYMRKYAFNLKTVIGVIIGRRSSPNIEQIKQPSEINVSVLFPAMITDGCILFHNTKATYVMWSTGAFQTELQPQDITSRITWNSITTISSEVLTNVKIPIIDDEIHQFYKSKGYIHFGNGLFFSPEKMLNSQPSWDELSMYPFNLICQYFKVNQKYSDLFCWFKKQKKRFLNEFSLENHEKENINNIIDHMINNGNTNLRSSYIIMRNLSLARIYSDDEDLNNLVGDEKLKKLLQFFKVMIQIMHEDNETNEDSTAYTSLSISNSRYISMSPSCTNKKYTNITAEFDKPFLWTKQFKYLYPNHKSILHECSICCENDIPLILVRKTFVSSDLNDVCEHYTDYFYPQIMCSRCAEFFCNRKEDPVHVKCFAAMPLFDIDSSSKKYFMQCINQLIKFDINTLEIESVMEMIIKASIEHFHSDNEILSILNKFKENFKNN